MSNAIDVLQQAMGKAMENRPQVGGFPYLAQYLKEAGVIRNVWHLPSCQSLYITKLGAVMVQGTPLVTGTVDVPAFDKAALIAALRTDQVGESSFPEFLNATWLAGVIRYDVDFDAHQVIYHGALGESYSESYPVVTLPAGKE
ncbi:hypothetical protein [Aeromonas sp.]|uniref:hypothetical protein n=1 Tax=Aeromonas sp. TaxID=647 RepID=UPI002584EB6E|nr:hypothetical protein [Aeromonas sp.]MCX7132337.1 hypothetical protein [Aeromonas sp.]